MCVNVYAHHWSFEPNAIYIHIFIYQAAEVSARRITSKTDVKILSIKTLSQQEKRKLNLHTWYTVHTLQMIV